MTPRIILTAVRMGQAVLEREDRALDILWAKFGTSVRTARQGHGITPKKFAKLLGVTPAMLGMMETGKRRWRMDRADMAARLLARPAQWPDCGRPR